MKLVRKTNFLVLGFLVKRAVVAFPQGQGNNPIDNKIQNDPKEIIHIENHGPTVHFHEALVEQQNKIQGTGLNRMVDDFDSTIGHSMEPFTLSGTMNTVFGPLSTPDTEDEAQAFEMDEDMDGNSTFRFGLLFRIPVINNYGCWCYGGDYWPGARDHTGQGPVVDVYDDACKAHHMGFDCIDMDSRKERIECYPNTQDYTLLIVPQMDGSYTMECDDDIQDDWCRKRTCLVDLRFLARHWKIQNEGIKPDYEKYGHEGFHRGQGTFDDKQCAANYDPNATSPKKPGLYFAQRVCCGDYPYRVWYDAKNTEGTKCCSYEDSDVTEDYGFTVNVGVLYDSNSGVCCQDGPKMGNNC